MRIIPVLDLMQGCVVRGVGGRREEYRPIRSRLTDSHDPLDVAAALHEHFGLREFYVADLDAIQGLSRQLQDVQKLRSTGYELLVDAGVRSTDHVDELFRSGASRVIAAQETLAGAAALRRILQGAGVERVLFSLDLQSGRLLGPAAGWESDTPLDRALEAIECGAASLIVLDLAGVGVKGGVPTLELCRRVRGEAPRVELITGGGVRHRDDLCRLRDAGVDGVLVASALHDGSLSRDDLAAVSA